MPFVISEQERKVILRRMAQTEGRLSRFRPWSPLENIVTVCLSAIGSQHILEGIALGASTGAFLGIIVGLVTSSLAGAFCFSVFLVVGTSLGIFRGLKLGVDLVKRHQQDVEEGLEFHLNLSRRVATHTYGFELNEG